MIIDRLGNDKYMYVYGGPGAEPLCVQHTEKSLRHYLGKRSAQVITLNDPSYFQDADKLKTVAAILVPGGSVYDISDNLGKTGLATIKELVQKRTAAYLGFCGGGYLAFETIHFQPYGKSYTFPFHPKLDLIDTPCYGPAYPFEGNPNSKTARVVRIQLAADFSNTFVLWNAGGYCKKSDTQIIANYTEVQDAIAVQKTAGNNPVVISHIHPEMRLSKEELERLYPHLSQSDKDNYLNSVPAQEKLFATICKAADILPGQN